MKAKQILLCVAGMLMAATMSAQLTVRPSGCTMLGHNDFEVNNVFPESRDTTTQLKIYGQGPWGEKARMSFGDQFWNFVSNVVLGEADTTNTDKLWLHGRSGLCVTFNNAYNDTLMSYSPNDDDMLGINTNIRAVALFLTSDERLKQNVEPIDDALSVVSALKGVSYQYKPAERDARFAAGLDALAAIDTTGSAARYKADLEKFYANRNDRTTHYGFLAQEVEQVLPELVHTGKDGTKSVDYIAVIPLLVNAVQELRAELAEVKGGEPLKSPARAPQAAGLDGVADGLTAPALYQNTPNPFTADTHIRYCLPESVQQADLYIYDMQGKQVKRITVSDRGESAVTLHGSELQAGMYIYALIADGQEVDSKRMILTK